MRDAIKNAKRIVVKVGSSTLCYPNGHLNLERIEHLVRQLSDLANQGKEVQALHHWDLKKSHEILYCVKHLLQ